MDCQKNIKMFKFYQLSFLHKVARVSEWRRPSFKLVTRNARQCHIQLFIKRSVVFILSFVVKIYQFAVTGEMETLWNQFGVYNHYLIL